MSYTPHASYVRVNNEKEYICYNTCFKLVKNLLKNNDKFKTIKLSNPKINERIVQVNNGAAVDYLVKVGFVREDGDNLLVFKGTTEFIQQEANTLEAICNKFKTTQENVGPATTTKKVDVTLLSKRSSKAVIRDREEAKLKEKRRLENQQRKQLLQKFKQDKKARSQPGWEAKVSAARAKGGVEIHKGEY